MKYFLLVCEGMAGDAMEELGGRTPLQAAKTVFMDALAQKGKLGLGALLPHTLPAAPEVALFSLLGFDPLRFYTGIAPLEALTLGIHLNARDVAFRCDFVTAAEGKMVDTSAGNISSKEALALLSDLKKKLCNDFRTLHPQGAGRNILIYRSASKAEELDGTECSPPHAVIGKKIASWLPKGKAAGELLEFMNATKTVLENHEVNRVRIDLKENPASQCWLWGQGQKLEMPLFKELHELEGGYFSEVNFVKGLGEAVGFKPYENFDVLGSLPFSLFYQSWPSKEVQPTELKDKIRCIEEFDAKVVGPLVKKLTALKEPWRLAVVMENRRNSAPILFYGAGIESKGAASFSEKNCAQSGFLIDPGVHFIKEFFKP